MQHLKTFSIFESTQELTQEQIDFLDKFTTGTWELNSEGLVDVQGDFDCSNLDLTDFKGIRFGSVSGHFLCSYNDLTTLDGAPREVGRIFSCIYNDLTTLKGAPQTVGGEFYCSSNNLTTLEGAPQTINRNFSCYNNNLTSLEGAPQTIGGKFSSDQVDVPRGQWSLQTLIEIYRNSAGRKKELLGTIVSTEALQKEIDANPEKMAIKLKSIVHLPEYKNLNWPKDLRSEVDLLSDLDGVGL